MAIQLLLTQTQHGGAPFPVRCVARSHMSMLHNLQVSACRACAQTLIRAGVRPRGGTNDSQADRLAVYEVARNYVRIISAYSFAVAATFCACHHFALPLFALFTQTTTTFLISWNRIVITGCSCNVLNVATNKLFLHAYVPPGAIGAAQHTDAGEIITKG